jgi:hypothetical protein
MNCMCCCYVPFDLVKGITVDSESSVVYFFSIFHAFFLFLIHKIGKIVLSVICTHITNSSGVVYV